MKTWGVSFKVLAPIAIGLAGVLVSCSSLVNLVDSSGSSGGGSSTDGSSVDGDFTNDPVSPGGTSTGGSGGGSAGQDDVDLPAETTRSFFTAFQIDPQEEDSAGPKFVVAGDVDQDGLMDLVSAWNQSQPIQLHLQRRDAFNNISFRTITIAGTSPIGVMAGVALGQFDDDGWLDIVVLVKADGGITLCPPETRACSTDAECNPACANDPNCTIVVTCGTRLAGVCDDFGDPTELTLLAGQIILYFSPGNVGQITDGDSWDELTLVNPFVQDPWIHNQFPGKEEKTFAEGQTHPEWNGFTSLAVGDLDNDGSDDIVVALNPADCKELAQEPPLNTVDLWLNPGGALSRIAELWGAPPPGSQSRNVPISLMTAAAQVKDVELSDVDGDGDLDVIATFTNALTLNVSWRRNPFIAHTPGGLSGRNEVERGETDGWHLFPLGWEARERPIGQLDTGADVLALGDMDGDGFEDVVVRSSDGNIVQWFRHPNQLSVAPEFPPPDEVPTRFNFPWPVFTVTEFDNQTPEAIAVGDITGDGQVELLVAVEGGVLWYDATLDTVFNPWFPNTIIQDAPSDTTDNTNAGGGTGGTGQQTAAPGSGVGVTEVDTSTSINALLVVDLDGDGKNDVIGTLDRRSGAGLSDDRLVWYRNVKTDDQ